MESLTASLTIFFCLSSQSKKPSPTSPDQRVPSQSNAATRGASSRTESRNGVIGEQIEDEQIEDQRIEDEPIKASLAVCWLEFRCHSLSQASRVGIFNFGHWCQCRSREGR